MNKRKTINVTLLVRAWGYENLAPDLVTARNRSFGFRPQISIGTFVPCFSNMPTALVMLSIGKNFKWSWLTKDRNPTTGLVARDENKGHVQNGEKRPPSWIRIRQFQFWNSIGWLDIKSFNNESTCNIEDILFLAPCQWVSETEKSCSFILNDKHYYRKPQLSCMFKSEQLRYNSLVRLVVFTSLQGSRLAEYKLCNRTLNIDDTLDSRQLRLSGWVTGSSAEAAPTCLSRIYTEEAFPTAQLRQRLLRLLLQDITYLVVQDPWFVIASPRLFTQLQQRSWNLSVCLFTKSRGDRMIDVRNSAGARITFYDESRTLT